VSAFILFTRRSKHEASLEHTSCTCIFNTFASCLLRHLKHHISDSFRIHTQTDRQTDVGYVEYTTRSWTRASDRRALILHVQQYACARRGVDCISGEGLIWLLHGPHDDFGEFRGRTTDFASVSCPQGRTTVLSIRAIFCCWDLQTWQSERVADVPLYRITLYKISPYTQRCKFAPAPATELIQKRLKVSEWVSTSTYLYPAHLSKKSHNAPQTKRTDTP